jgi:hypothetical protein
VNPADHSLSRRSLLRCGVGGAAGLLLSDRLCRPAAAAPVAKAKAVIQIWLWGGPSHLDTFDPKPQAGSDYTGPFTKPIATGVDGLYFNELLPSLAKQSDKLAVIRSMTHGVNGHETASYMVQTGRPAGGRDVYPGVGAVVSCLRGYAAGYKSLIPPYVVLTQPQGRFSEAGFLGTRYKPFATGGDPGRKEFLVEGIAAKGITQRRQRSRRDLLGKLDALRGARKGHAGLKELDRAEEQAYELILGDAGKVFDLSQETDALRDRYGRGTLGQSCLAARRLVEQGVRYVTINSKGWDTHKQHFQTMRRRLPELDRGVSTLLADLAQRGLLESTIVWVSGEFGRGPRVQYEPPWNGGRSHHGRVFSTLLAGGGFKGGCVVGSSDAKGMDVAERPVYPWDLVGSIYHQLGIAPDTKLPHPMGKAVTVLAPAKKGTPSGGLLREIM